MRPKFILSYHECTFYPNKAIDYNEALPYLLLFYLLILKSLIYISTNYCIYELLHVVVERGK